MNLPKQCKKRSLAILLALAVFFTYSLPMSAFAITEGTVSGVSANGKSVISDDGAVTIQKTAKATDTENEYEITLDIKTKDNVEVTTQVQDAAVVLVMDVSNSMKDTIDGRETRGNEYNRLTIAKRTAKEFLSEYAKNAGNSKRYVSVVQFGTDAKRLGTAFVDVNTEAGLTAANGFINDLNYDGATNIEAGLALARNIVNSAPNNVSNKSVILLTDGAPTEPAKNVRSTDTSEIKSANKKTGGITNIEDVDDLQGIVAEIKNAGAKVHAVNFAYGQSYIDIFENGVKKESFKGKWSDWEELDNEPGNKEITKKKGKYTYYRSTVNQHVYRSYETGWFTTKTVWEEKYPYLYKSEPIEQWYVNSVGVDGYYEADNTTELMDAFSKINKTIETPLKAEGLKVTDPMGMFINFDKDSIKDIQYAKFDNDILTWSPSEPTSVSADGVKNYKLTYKVKLDVEKEGFEEGKEYATNGITTLTYTYKDKEKTLNFDVPKVKGVVPTVQYNVEYYKWDKGTKDYPSEPTDELIALEAKLWTKVEAPSGYADKYQNDNYYFAEGDSIKQIEKVDKNGNNVIKLYYKPLTATVTVNHYYKTDVIKKDGTKVKATDYELKITVPNQDLYVGDKFTAQEINPLDGVAYKLDSQSDDKEVTVAKGGNTINLYYFGEDDQREVGTVVVNRILKTGKWELNADGRYEEKFDVANPQEVAKVTDARIPQDFKANVEAPVGYSFESTDKGELSADEKTVDIRLTEKNTVINITYVKHANKNTLKPAKVKLIHKYVLTEKTVEGGLFKKEVKSIKFVDADATKGYYVGEKFTPVQRLEKDGVTYVADSSNAAKIKAYTLGNDELEIVLNYHAIKEPKKTAVTVNHIYRTYEKQYAEVKDSQGNVIGHEVKEKVLVDVKTDTETINTFKYDGKDENLYEGMTHTASLKSEYGGKIYVINDTDSTASYKIDSLDKDPEKNVIELYYDITKDNREVATLNVTHKYITKKKTVKDGKVVEDVDSFNGENGEVRDTAKDRFVGKAGDTFAVTPVYDYDCDGAGPISSETYELVAYMYGNKEYKVDSEHPFKPNLEVEPGSHSMVLIYEFDRDTKDIKQATLEVFHKYIKKVMKIVNGTAKYEEQPPQYGPKKTWGFGSDKKYEGEIVKVQPEKKFNNEDYTESADNPATDITLKAGENKATYKYVKEEPLPKMTVNVRGHYIDTNINAVGKKASKQFDTSNAPIPYYVGEDVKVEPILAGYKLKNVEVSLAEAEYKKDAAGNVSFVAPEKDVNVNYYYERITDNSKKANIVVKHYYRTLDWNDEPDKAYTLADAQTKKESSYATLSYTAKPDLRADAEGKATFVLDNVKYSGPTGINKDTYTVKLIEGENTIEFYYTQKVDTRVAATVTVLHNYYKHDISGIVPDDSDGVKVLPGVLAGTYAEVFAGTKENAWVGNKFTAQQKPKFGIEGAELTYKFVNAEPGITIASLKAEGNVIVINYLYEYDARDNMKFIIKHVYKEGATVDKEETVIAQRPNTENGTWNDDARTFTAKPRPTSRYYLATAESEYSNVPYSEGVKEIVIVYQYHRSPSGPDDNTGNNPGNNPGTTPNTNISDNPVPLSDNPTVDITDNEVPLADAPTKGSDAIEILDGKVPLAGLPKTGGYGVAGIVVLGGMLALAGIYLGRKKEQ
ncbi:MAG: doubled motif LPXTG anchor domain-containing protein [Clostridiales bacterium]|nr:doubled motif LPXTG anchor domain-containing protein [Clostridiales bacterium]